MSPSVIIGLVIVGLIIAFGGKNLFKNGGGSSGGSRGGSGGSNSTGGE